MVRFMCFGEVLLRFTPAESGLSPDIAAKEKWQQSVAGAELNIAVALSRLGWQSLKIISVAPPGAKGDHIIELAKKALCGTGMTAEKLGDKGGCLAFRRAGEDIGTVHIWSQRRREYDRDQSAFTLLDPSWFDDAFWNGLFASSDSVEDKMPLTVFHLSGVPPLLSTTTSQAWASSLVSAVRARDSGMPLLVTLELTPRNEVGGYLELWMKTVPHLASIDILVLSLNILSPLCTLLGASESEGMDGLDDLRPALAGIDVIKCQKLPTGLASLEEVDRLLARILKDLHQLVVGKGSRPALVVTCKLLGAKRPAPDSSPMQQRWSLACIGDRVISTAKTAVRHQPPSSEGGNDAWLAGLIDKLTSSVKEGVKKSEGPYQLTVKPEEWAAALRVGDTLAALKQDRVELSSDLSAVTRSDLDAALSSGTADGAEGVAGVESCKK
mmetsp:Transcript_30066/g.55540  ORF Transcript_30066/g.55540 Transcript_30066/m.55540 type:complete len:440 (-) Transcript_30066:49-1368(-)